MRKIPNRLWDALSAIAQMQNPPIAGLLRKLGYSYEADRMDELTDAIKQANDREEKRNGRNRNTNRAR